MGARGSASHHSNQPRRRSSADVSSQRRMSRAISTISTSNEMKEADIKFVVERTGLSRSEVKSIYNKFIKESVDGQELDLDGFIDFYSQLLTDEPPEYLRENAQFIFDTFDKDHSGRVSFREFMSAYVLTTPGNLEKKLEYTFELYDLDNNGYLDLDEIYRIAVRIFDLLGSSQSNDEKALRFAEEVVRKLDVNPRDGKVTKDEYVAGMINNPELRLLITPFVA